MPVHQPGRLITRVKSRSKTRCGPASPCRRPCGTHGWPERRRSDGISHSRARFLSRQVLTHPSEDDESFFDDFIERTRRSSFYSSALYAASLRPKVRPGAVRGIFESMVDMSDRGDLMPRFLSLPCPRMFMYGEQNSSLSYLAKLSANGVGLALPMLCRGAVRTGWRLQGSRVRSG
jgi:hypothetical protein